MNKFEYNGYGCPETEMWMFRAKFESEVDPQKEHLTEADFNMRMDAPHYDSRKTRIAYFELMKDCEMSNAKT